MPITGVRAVAHYAHQHGTKILQDPPPNDIPAIALYFRERGYATGAIGKMHCVDETRKHGFDHRLNERSFHDTLSAEDRRKPRGDAGALKARGWTCGAVL
ncbi:MAG: hypothetical protein ACKV2U_19730 [Bryobacteraceae bacterium]